MISPEFCLELLKNKIKVNPLIESTELYSTEIWRQSQFDKLSEIIQNDLKQKSFNDNRVSVSTLEKIFKYGYPISDPIERRQLATLDKLAVFAGYKGFNSFRKLYSEEVFNIVHKACEAEFKTYQNLPNYDISELKEYYQEDGPALKKIIAILKKLVDQQDALLGPDNPSTYVIYDVQFLRFHNDEIILKTHEYWYLRWYNTVTKKVAAVYNEDNEQKYILRLVNDKWKIRVNSYQLG